MLFTAAYVLGSHGVHMPPALGPVTLPGAQGMHLSPIASVPGTQARHSVPPVLEKVPPLHGTHADAPVVADTVPPSHDEHDAAPPVENVPLSHEMQSWRPL